MCESKELIVGYVYGELSGDEQARFDAHLAGCTDCRIEIEELKTTRAHLALWTPPELDLGYRLIRGDAAVPASLAPRRIRFVPAFAFAAAAVIVLAAAAAIANVEVRYGNDGLVVRTGWARGDARAEEREQGIRQASGASADRLAAVPAAASADFAALDRRLQQVEAVLNSQQPAAARQSASSSRVSDAEILRRVRQIVAEAEARQQTAVAQQMLEVVKDFDQQRRRDLALIQQGLGQYQGLTNAEIAQNRDMLNQLVRAAASRQER
jgi:hypothetical protein